MAACANDTPGPEAPLPSPGPQARLDSMLHVSLILWLTGLDEMLCELLRSPSLSVRLTRGVGGVVISPARSFRPCQEGQGS